jgi:hypothetical protein
MMRRSWIFAVVVTVVVVAGGWYLHDPPWAGRVTSGLREWEQDAAGVRFRWTAGHASFFIPATASEMTLPMRAFFPRADRNPVVVKMSVDDRWLTDVLLPDPATWETPTVPLPRPTGRRYRRVDLRVSRVVGFLNLGVQVGEPRFR